MAITQISKVASTSGDVWTELIAHAGAAGTSTTLTSLVMASLSIGDAKIGVRLNKAVGGIKMIVPADTLAEGESYRLPTPGIILEPSDKIEVRSLGAVDWIASGVKQT